MSIPLRRKNRPKMRSRWSSRSCFQAVPRTYSYLLTYLFTGCNCCCECGFDTRYNFFYYFGTRSKN